MEPNRQTWSGIAPATLISQIQSTVPFLFQNLEAKQTRERRYLEVLARWQNMPADFLPSHVEYFELCLVAHFSTVGSFVPTDVDNQIRSKIWLTAPDTATKLQLLALVREFLTWDILPVAGRFIRSTSDASYLSGLDGEWMGCAVAAYANFKKIAPEESKKIHQEILENLEKAKRIYFEQVRAHDGIEVMKAVAMIAHNLGDLDRVIDIWNLPTDDPLRVDVYKIGHQENARFSDAFTIPGNLNKRFMAVENHRQYSLREPKALRKKWEFLPPIAPFFDDWGSTLAADSDLEERDLAEILEVLIKGFHRLAGPVGYARALAGFENRFRGGLKAALRLLPVRVGKDWSSGRLRAECTVSKERFLEKWASYPFDRKNHLPVLEKKL